MIKYHIEDENLDGVYICTDYGDTQWLTSEEYEVFLKERENLEWIETTTT